jgi:hypothetical protein
MSGPVHPPALPRTRWMSCWLRMTYRILPELIHAARRSMAGSRWEGNGASTTDEDGVSPAACRVEGPFLPVGVSAGRIGGGGPETG